MSKLTNRDWWLNRTPEQLARKERIMAWGGDAEEMGGKIQRIGVSFVLYLTIPLIILVATFPLGVVLAPLAAWVIYRMRKRKS